VDDYNTALKVMDKWIVETLCEHTRPSLE
jgi:hypothetical protein